MAVLERVAPDDPNRCQAVGKSGQCPFKADGTFDRVKQRWEGSSYCSRHSGLSKLVAGKEERRLYLAALWKDRIGEQADHPRIKSLREEIGIMRMTLDTKLESLQDDTELLMHAAAITEMVRAIEKLVKSCNYVELSTDMMLDKNQALAWVQELIVIISKYIADSDILNQISEEMVLSLENRTTQPRTE